MFNLYKNWKRQQIVKHEVSHNKEFKPTDLFFSKILPALQEKGINNVSSRKDWPLDILKKVFLELLSETPK